MTALHLEPAEDRARRGQAPNLAPSTPGAAAAPGAFRAVRSERRCGVGIDLPLATPGREYYLDAAGLASLLRTHGRTAAKAVRLRLERPSFLGGHAAAFSTPVAARRAAAPAAALGGRPPSSRAARAPLAELHDESAWLSTFDGQPRSSWEALVLNRQATSLRSADGFNIPAKHHPSLWQWKKGDATTLKWRPQGITGSRAAGSPARANWLAISWYGRAEKSNEHAGVRISFVDVEPGSPSFLEYRHVLLVQDARNVDDPELFALPRDARRYQQLGGFAPVPIHAGGIAWVGERLFVADTRLGLRVFDPTRIYRAHAYAGRARCGLQDGKAYAFDYGYVLPQVGYYRTPGTAPNSFVSVGSGAHGACLWVGQYLKKASKRTPKLFGWTLLPEGGIDTTRAAETFAPDDGGGPAYNVQGAYRAAGATWLTTTGRPRYHGSTARLVTQGPHGHGLRWRWPHGAEDLYLQADTRTLWCLTEFAASESSGERFVFGVSLPTYAPQLHPSA